MDKDLLKMLATLGLIAVVAIWGSNYLMKFQCRNNVEEMGREYRYDIVNGCRIKLDDGTFIYWRMYRVID
mgnify:CR=1 FL=1